MYQLFVGLFTEGKTDNRFLKSIVERTIYKIALDKSIELEPYVQIIKIEEKGNGFIEQVLAASRKGVDAFGIQFLCVHKDADNSSDENTFKNNINPADKRLKEQNDEYCKILIPIIPIQETESWMLVDKELLKLQIGTNKSDNELGINRNPENIANPKEVIKNAIVIARKDLPKRKRKKLAISDLYAPIGKSINMKELEKLSSYQKFEANTRDAFKKLNLLY